MTRKIQINRQPDMPNKKNARSTRRPAAGAHAKSLFLPMRRNESTDLALRARLALERLRKGEADRALINLVSQVVIIASHHPGGTWAARYRRDRTR
ncbi:hypothetical protein PUN4_180078 [Paraburkholderia unamae]|nr:hypothetical protein PUN4_180078 [Paraburkholderia unamae]